MQNFHGDTVMRWWTKSSSGVAKRGVSGLKLRHWFREKEIFHVVMLQFPFVTKITMLNISKYININPKTHLASQITGYATEITYHRLTYGCPDLSDFVQQFRVFLTWLHFV